MQVARVFSQSVSCFDGGGAHSALAVVQPTQLLNLRLHSSTQTAKSKAGWVRQQVVQWDRRSWTCRCNWQHSEDGSDDLEHHHLSCPGISSDADGGGGKSSDGKEREQRNRISRRQSDEKEHPDLLERGSYMNGRTVRAARAGFSPASG